MDGVMRDKIPQNRVSKGYKGEIFMCINAKILSKTITVYKPYKFILSVSNPQSLITCKRVSVKSHFTWFLRASRLVQSTLGNVTFNMHG